ncbi:MAG: HlyD family efflux transporter periplasmic adaptor subunit [Bacteroidota bacterium]
MQKIISIKYTLITTLLSILLISCGNESQSKEQEASLTGKAISTSTPTMNIPEVKVMEIQNENIANIITLTGRLQASREISVVSEVQGKILPQRKELDKGVVFKKGETLLSIERTQTDLSLYAMRAKFLSQVMNLLSDLESDHPEAFPKWKTYADSFDHKKILPELPAFTSEREKYLFNLHNIPGQYLDIKTQEDRLSKYHIKAPFSGIITQSNVDYGDIISPGAPLATLLGTSVYEYEAAVNEEDIAYLKIGNTVTLQNTNTGKNYEGRILRTGGIIDANTQTIPIYISVSGRDLKQGMYLEGEVKGKSFEQVAAIPSNLITRNNEVYLVKEDAIELLPVERVGSAAGKTLVRGIPDGSLMVNQTISTSTLRAKIKPILTKNTQRITLR